MQRRTLALMAIVASLGIAAAGCGGSEEATPTAETTTGAAPTETTGTETTATETATTETTGTETTATETTTTETTGTETTETETTEPAGEGNAEAGKAIFTGSSGCSGCHTLSDAGATGTVGPNLDDTQPSFELAVDRVTNGKGNMPSFSGTLSEQQIRDVATYVSTAAGD